MAVYNTLFYLILGIGSGVALSVGFVLIRRRQRKLQIDLDHRDVG